MLKNFLLVNSCNELNFSILCKNYISNGIQEVRVMLLVNDIRYKESY